MARNHKEHVPHTDQCSGRIDPRTCHPLGMRFGEPRTANLRALLPALWAMLCRLDHLCQLWSLLWPQRPHCSRFGIIFWPPQSCTSEANFRLTSGHCCWHWYCGQCCAASITSANFCLFCGHGGLIVRALVSYSGCLDPAPLRLVFVEALLFGPWVVRALGARLLGCCYLCSTLDPLLFLSVAGIHFSAIVFPPSIKLLYCTNDGPNTRWVYSNLPGLWTTTHSLLPHWTMMPSLTILA